MSVVDLDGRRKEKMVENHVSTTSSWQEEENKLLKIMSVVDLDGRRKEKIGLKIMLVQHLDGR